LVPKINIWRIIILIFLFSKSILAAGLYYLAELVEEYTVLAKKTIKYMVLFDIIIYSLFIFTENFSWSMILCGLIAQLLHLAIIRNFPFVKFLSVEFLVAFLFLLINHYLGKWSFHIWSQLRWKPHKNNFYVKEIIGIVGKLRNALGRIFVSEDKILHCGRHS
jgi:hypothetical protein